jgi:hypothetical protein
MMPPPMMPSRPPLYMMLPVPPPEPELTGGQKTGRFFGGLGLGVLPFLIPVLLAVILGRVLSGSQGSILSLLGTLFAFVPFLLYVAALAYMIYCLTQRRLRFIGYGMLTTLVILPVVLVVSCIVIITASSRSG